MKRGFLSIIVVFFTMTLFIAFYQKEVDRPAKKISLDGSFPFVQMSVIQLKKLLYDSWVMLSNVKNSTSLKHVNYVTYLRNLVTIIHGKLLTFILLITKAFTKAPATWFV